MSSQATLHENTSPPSTLLLVSDIDKHIYKAVRETKGREGRQRRDITKKKIQEAYVLGKAMNAPLEHMIKAFSSDKRKIKKYCKQWHRDTKDNAQPWPKEGTFDDDIVEQTLTNIRSKYQKKKRKKREAILSLWWVFCDTKTNVKVTEPKEAVMQAQENPHSRLQRSPHHLVCILLWRLLGIRIQNGLNPRKTGQM
ncbi:hypothetical protein NDU88_001561 [Pleurodeles waltl]|uniref:Uncharacterized protein n=1 Tax=Pleurodeles waltl TaxID=8319 RepID=A0AAV7PBI8_PLEWA|nr:hypothetical protein NDU88_001561 [Pleurodeles waltl]